MSQGSCAQQNQRKKKHTYITNDRVQKIIGKLKTNKCPGVDGLHPRVLNELNDKITETLADVMRTSLQTSVLPEDWKRANVTPIFKKGDKKSANNYRPVSLTSIPCKCMKKIMKLWHTWNQATYSQTSNSASYQEGLQFDSSYMYWTSGQNWSTKDIPPMLYTWIIRKLLIQCPTEDWSANWLAMVSEERY